MKPIVLVVQGLGHVPSFKNRKRAILDSHTGRMRTLTEPRIKQWMKRCEAGFVSQLLYAYQTTESAMPMARSRASWIACVMPLNDSVRSIPSVSVEVIRVPQGEEGAEIEITPL